MQTINFSSYKLDEFLHTPIKDSNASVNVSKAQFSYLSIEFKSIWSNFEGMKYEAVD